MWRNKFKTLCISIIFVLFIFIGIGYSYLSSNLSMNTNVNVSKYVRRFNLVEEIAKDAVVDNIASAYVVSETGIDFSQISSDTNGKGIYLLASTSDDANPIYYYRGAVDNNNVKFANFCWKIVRTTETGGVKLIYNGIPNSDGYCTNTTGGSTSIGNGSYSFNKVKSDNAYVGYMYGTIGASTYEESHKNVNSSMAKTQVDTWYETNMTSYTSKLEDTIWCNDRSFYSGTGIGTVDTFYSAFSRLSVNKSPSLQCLNDNDKFTVRSGNGNGVLTYPVALLTADEAVYAGAVMDVENTSYYLYTNFYSWLMTPAFSKDSSAHGFALRPEGFVSTNYIYNVMGLRPTVSLIPKVVASGDGTSTSPYIIY